MINQQELLGSKINNQDLQAKATLPLGLKIPQSTRNQNNNFFRDELQDLEAFYAFDKDQEVQQVNERAQQAMRQLEQQSPTNCYSDVKPNSGRQSKDGFQKRASIHNKRGRNQPSQNSNHNRTPSQNHARHHNLLTRQSPTTTTTQQQQQQHQQLNNQEIMIINLSKKDDSFYGNDEDIYEMERLGNVMLLNQVKLKDDTSLSLVNDSNLIVTNEYMNKIQDPRVQVCQSSLKNHDNQSMQNEFQFMNQFKTYEPITNTNRFGPVEQELDDSVSRINQSDFNNNPYLLQQRSLSLTSYNTFSNQQSIYRKTRQIKRPESNSPLQDFKSISSGKILRRDSSMGHLFESPSERTILDVLGLCSTNTKNNNNNQGQQQQLKESAFMSIIPYNLNNVYGLNGQEISEIFQVEGLNNQGSINIGNNAQAILMQSQYQNLEIPSKMPSLMFMNQSSSSQNPQILFNNHPGCNGSYTGDSFSTNKMVNNFLDEKRKELEALQEVDRESDTTEQMTFSQNSRECSPDSRADQQNQNDYEHHLGQNDLVLNEELIVEDFDLVDSKNGIECLGNDKLINHGKVHDENDIDFKDEDMQQRMLRRTSRIFDYYNKGKKNTLSKRKKKRRIISTNGGNNILSAQSCTRGSNIQLMSIRDILIDKDSENIQHYQQQLIMTPSDLIQNKVDSSSLIEMLINKDSLVMQSEQKFQRPVQNNKLSHANGLLQNRKYSEVHNIHQLNNLLLQSTPSSALKTHNQITAISNINQQKHLNYINNDIEQFELEQTLQQKNDLNSKQSLKALTSRNMLRDSEQKSRNTFFSKTILTAAPQIIQRENSQIQLKPSSTSKDIMGIKQFNLMLSDCNVNGNSNNQQKLYTPLNNNKSIKDLRSLNKLIDGPVLQTNQSKSKLLNSNEQVNSKNRLNQPSNESYNQVKSINLSQGRKQVKTARNLTNISNDSQQQQFNYYKHRNSLAPQQIGASQSSNSKRSTQNLQQTKTNQKLTQQQQNDQIEQLLLVNDECGLPKSHNGRETNNKQQLNLRNSFEPIPPQNVQQLQKELLNDVFIVEQELNLTAPEDLSMSQMNTGNNTVDMKIQNAANIKTFDFRPSKQVKHE